jgi:hypothetical protein
MPVRHGKTKKATITHVVDTGEKFFTVSMYDSSLVLTPVKCGNK